MKFKHRFLLAMKKKFLNKDHPYSREATIEGHESEHLRSRRSSAGAGRAKGPHRGLLVGI